MQLRCVVLLLLLLPGQRLLGQDSYTTLLGSANNALKAGHNDDALASAQQAIASDRMRWEAYAIEGAARLNLKQYEEAQDAFSKAIELAPQNKQPALRDMRKQCAAAETTSGGLTHAIDSTAAASNDAGAENSNQPHTHPTQTGTSILHIYRPKQMEGNAAHPLVQIDNKRVAQIMQKQAIRVPIPSGTHTITIGDLQLPPIQMQPDVEYWIQVKVSARDHPKPVSVSAEQGESESSKLEQLRLGVLPE